MTDSASVPAGDLATGVELGHRLVDGIIAHDWELVASCFAPEARFLAVVANDTKPFREHVGGEAAAAAISRWFGDDDVTELVASEVEAMADRVRVSYRVHGHNPEDGWYLVEQMVYATPGPDGFQRVNLACSGFRPAPT
ncbi:MAG TPA: nuclear transport factor 2 family protein [Candidatus Limnocylindria bacterium]